MENFDLVDKSETSRYFICGICLNIISSPKKLICDHYFCKECITSWFKKKASCPTCNGQGDEYYAKYHVNTDKYLRDPDRFYLEMLN